jgi:hypothetical protein
METQQSTRKLSIGNNAIVIGDVTGSVGDGAVVIVPNSDGNVLMPQVSGDGAYAAIGSIAIGAGACAGDPPYKRIPVQKEDGKTIED